MNQPKKDEIWPRMLFGNDIEFSSFNISTNHIIKEIISHYGAEYSQIKILSQKLIAENQINSFLLRPHRFDHTLGLLASPGIAIPHLEVSSDIVGEGCIGWFRSKEGILFENEKTKAHLIFVALAERERLKLIMTHAVEMLTNGQFSLALYKCDSATVMKVLVDSARSRAYEAIKNYDPFVEVDVKLPNAGAKVKVVNQRGIHARFAAKFVRIAASHDCFVQVEREGLRVPGTSIMGLMMLAAGTGAIVTIRAFGEDAQAAVDELEAMVAEGGWEP